MLLQYGVQITPESARHVHHILVYLCDGMNLTGDPAIGVSQECNGISERIRPCKFSTIIAGWAVGGNVRHYTATVAMPCCLGRLLLHTKTSFTEFHVSRRTWIAYWWSR